MTVLDPDWFRTESTRAAERSVSLVQAIVVVRTVSLVLLVALLPTTVAPERVTVPGNVSVRLPLPVVGHAALFVCLVVVTLLEGFALTRLRTFGQASRLVVLFSEEAAATLSVVLLIAGMHRAAFPLALAVGSCCILLQNNVAWTFKLHPHPQPRAVTRKTSARRALGDSVDTTLHHQTVGYARRSKPLGTATGLATRPGLAATRPVHVGAYKVTVVPLSSSGPRSK